MAKFEKKDLGIKKVVLAYSGGLDTSVAVKWMQEYYGVKEVITLALDLGQGDELKPIQEKALKIGAKESLVVDAKQEFIDEYLWPALKANALYEGKYPLATALGRPLIAAKLVEVAQKYKADAIAHGSTGKGNDQVRFDISTQALDPSLQVLAPAREWGMSRDESIDYAQKNNIPVPVGKKNPFSVDINLWGRSVESGILEDPYSEPPEEAYALTKSLNDAPNEPEYIEIEFKKGIPVAVNGKNMKSLELIIELNKICGKHGVGRIDMIENRLVGIKSREIYESPAAVALIRAHQELESLVLDKDTLHFKKTLEHKYAELVYNGLWYSPLRLHIQSFVDSTQEYMDGTVRVKLHKGNATPVGRKSPYALYRHDLSTYDAADSFDHKAAIGFIKLWGLPISIYSQIHKKK